MSLNKEEVNYKKANKILFVLIIISLILIFARITPTVKAIKYLAFSIISPTLEFTSGTFSATNNLISNISNILNVNQENIELKKQIVELNYKLTDFDLIQEENLRLKNLLSLPQKQDTIKIIANIITREPSQWYQWVLVNKGEIDGIEKDLPVLCVLKNNKLCVFGRVLEVFNSSSKVALITNSLFSIPVQIKSSKTDCLINGYNSQLLNLSYVPQNVKIKTDDEIVTGNLSNVFNREIPIGKITEISKTKLGDYEEILVLPYCQTESINEVIILKTKDK